MTGIDTRRLHAEWQGAWHDLFDQDAQFVATVENARPNPLPESIDCDFRLIFGLSQVSAATRASCFALFPSGPIMAERLEAYLGKKAAPISESEARLRLDELLELACEIAPKAVSELEGLPVICGDRASLIERLNASDDLSWLFEDNHSSLSAEAEAMALAVERFLSEPLYATAGNFHQLREWVTSALRGGATEDFQRQVFELFAGGWQVALGEDAVLLAKI
jgi:hypothetical protein